LTVLGPRSGGLRSVVKLEVLAEKGVSCQPSKIFFFGILRKGILGLKLGRDFISSPPTASAHSLLISSSRTSPLVPGRGPVGGGHDVVVECKIEG
jgi:hypothetical protein